MPIPLHYVLVTLGLVAGIFVGSMLDTEPRILGWLFAIGAGIAGGALLAAIVSGDALASGPRSSTGRARGSAARPAWFDEPAETRDDHRPKSDN